MSKEIYSEGRVVGYSAYEIYLKHHMEEFPDTPPASEKQWLAASLAMGASLIVKIPANNLTGNQHFQIQLPADTRLVAGNPIVGSLFLGTATYSGSWATEVNSMRGIDNTSSVSTPEQTAADIDDVSVRSAVLNYLKFHDWSITFSETWEVSEQAAPYYDMKPDFTNGVSYLNVQHEGPLDTDVQVLLTGFTSKCVLSGTVGVTGSVNTPRPENGDFLGPEVFPWVAPVELLIPVEAAALNIFELATKYWRKYPTTANEDKVTSDPVIDYNYNNPADMYDATHHPNSLTTADVTRIDFGSDKDSKAVLMAKSYDPTNKRPAALFGGVASAIGDVTLGPLDTYAPNTVKLFESTADAIDYEQNVPYNYALYRDSNKVLNQIDLSTSTVVPVADFSTTNNAVTINIGNKSETINKTSISTATTSTTFVSGATTAVVEKVDLSEANNSVTIAVGDVSKTIPLASVTTATNGTTVVAGTSSAVLPTIKIETDPQGQSVIWIGGTSSVISSAQIGWTSNANAAWTKVGPSTAYALSMATSGGSLYDLSGSSSSLDKTFTRTVISGGYKYYADVTWSNFVDMLHNNRKLRLEFITYSADPTGAAYYDVGAIFRHYFSSRSLPNIPANFVYGTTYVPTSVAMFGKMTGEVNSTDSNAPCQCRILLKIDKSDYSPVSRITLRFKFFNNTAVTVSKGGSDSQHAHFEFAWRGTDSDYNNGLVGNTSPGASWQPGTPISYVWDSIPDSPNPYEALAGNQFEFNNSRNSWGASFRLAFWGIQNSGVSNDDCASLSDTSFNYSNSTAALEYRLGYMSSSATYTWPARGDGWDSSDVQNVYENVTATEVWDIKGVAAIQ